MDEQLEKQLEEQTQPSDPTPAQTDPPAAIVESSKVEPTPSLPPTVEPYPSASDIQHPEPPAADKLPPW